MNEQVKSEVPVWFWVLAVLAVLWNAMGMFAYVSDVTLSPDAVAALPQAQQDLRAATPSWVTGAYAIAVTAGLLAALCLLLRKTWAVPLFIVSLAAVVLQMGYVIVIMKAPAALGASAIVLPAIVIVLGALQLWFATSAKAKSWLS